MPELHITSDQALQCCASQQFARGVASAGPYSSLTKLVDRARHVWWNEVGIPEWLAAFAAHPRIGDVEGLRKKFDAFAELSKGEQGQLGASEQVLQDLAAWNAKYEVKFGHIFIICASGRSAAEMLQAVQQRFANSAYLELSLAAQEQMKITELRLRQVLGPQPVSQHNAAVGSSASQEQSAERRAGRVLAHLSGGPKAAAGPPKAQRSPVTSHVLDIASGKPAAGVKVDLQRAAPGSNSTVWEPLASGLTNDNGRVEDLLPPGGPVEPGSYRVLFDMAAYTRDCHQQHPAFFKEAPFYPLAVVYFQILPEQVNEHFHIPLTWSPYGYTTYRGS